MTSELSFTDLERRLSQLLQETEHFCGWRQEKVAKIVPYAPPLISFRFDITSQIPPSATGPTSVEKKDQSRVADLFSCRNFCKPTYVNVSQSNTRSEIRIGKISNVLPVIKTANNCKAPIDPASVLNKILSNGECGCRGEDGNQ